MLDFSRFRVLTFDCYGTLVDWETGIFSAVRPILAAHGKHVPDDEVLRLYGELEADAEAGEYCSYREVLQDVVKGFGQRLRFAPSASEISSLPDSVGLWQPFPDTISALRQLQPKFRLAIISNIDDDIFAATSRLLEVKFDVVTTAQQARAYKPSLKLFQLAESRLTVPREQWLHIGQSLYHDVVPAQSLGISTVWINRPSPRPGAGAAKAASGKPDLEAPNLQTLADLAVGKG
jgi:2-haloacid dehalogenase